MIWKQNWSRGMGGAEFIGWTWRDRGPEATEMLRLANKAHASERRG